MRSGGKALLVRGGYVKKEYAKYHGFRGKNGNSERKGWVQRIMGFEN